jgi:drug/metabolite transporter (DMT)-like permease
MFGIRNPRHAGMAAMLFAVAMFAVMDAGLKVLSTHYSAAQVSGLRGLVALPIVLIWALAVEGWRPLFRVRYGLQILRGLIGVAMMLGFTFGLKTLGLTEAYAIFFVAPLMIALLSWALLREAVTSLQWLAIALGFVGVLIALKPSGAGLVSLGGLAMLVSATGYALAAVLVRVIVRTDSTHSLMFWFTGIMALGATLLALPQWQPVRAADIGVLAMIGVTGAVAQYGITRAFTLASAATIAPLEYTALAWGLLIDMTIWGVVPQWRTLIGAGVIVVSGIYCCVPRQDRP